MLKSYYILLLFLLGIVSCQKFKPALSPEAKSGYTVVNNGSGAVDSKTDNSGDTVSLHVAQAIPSVNNQSYFSNMPIIFFMDDKVLLSSIYDNFEVTQNTVKVKGTIYVNESSNGFAIITFTPTEAFGSQKSINITLRKGMQDDAGNTLRSDYVLNYVTKDASVISFDNNKDFERNITGVSFSGAGSVMTGTIGTVKPYQGYRFGAISTGPGSIGEASSMMFLGPIATDLSSITFAYDFISCEFNDYLNSKFDDVAMVTISGPKGAYSEVITSVNKVGLNNTLVSWPNLPDAGDSYVGHTGWLKRTVNFKNVGTPAFIIFTITDVQDLQATSVLAVDSLAY